MDDVKIFENVRDIPFHCPESAEDKDYRCWGKHRVLKQELEKNGYKSRFRACSFKWSNQRLPPDITSKAPSDNDVHLFLELFKGGKWIILDCSNDSKLPDYNKWDGKSDCNIAVNFIKVFTPEESADIETNEKSSFQIKVLGYSEFHKAVNKFFSKLRSIEK